MSDTTQKKVQKLTIQMEELENRQRRSNLRLLGIPEGAEKGNARTFLMAWLPKALGLSIEQPFTIKQAYWLGTSPQNQARTGETRPRILLVKFLTYRDKDRVMKTARLKEKVLFENSHVMIFPDLSAEVQKQWKLFDGVKQRLRHLRKEYGFMFPARLRIQHKGTWHYFSSPVKAEEFIRQMESSSPEDSSQDHQENGE
ncbi:hypothetical protein AALO_G00133050 [Alosa alosa]|uniref:Uncharacterized protein n=1 Tax=Alosa alosa TaxID=278164 RepID=A0AAV6GKF5_9TELE|nr:hypothetical protein AALO_G00133050 [Alosa alosa]